MLPRSHRGDRSRRVLCRQTSKSRSLTSSKLKEENMISYESFLHIWRGCNHHFWCPTASYPPFYSSKTLLQGLWLKAEIETESISKARSGRLWSKHPLHSQYVRLWLFWPQPSSCFAAFLCQSLSPAPGHCQTSPMHLCILIRYICIFRVFASWVEAVRGYLLYLYIFVCFN